MTQTVARAMWVIDIVTIPFVCGLIPFIDVYYVDIRNWNGNFTHWMI